MQRTSPISKVSLRLKTNFISLFTNLGVVDTCSTLARGTLGTLGAGDIGLTD